MPLCCYIYIVTPPTDIAVYSFILRTFSLFLSEFFTDIRAIMFSFKKASSLFTIAVLGLSAVASSVPANAVETVAPYVNAEYVMPNDGVQVASDVSLDTVADEEYVVVSAPVELKPIIDDASSYKKFAENSQQVVSLVTKKEALKLASENSNITVETNQPVYMDDVQNNATWGLDRIDSPNLPLSSTYVYNEDGSGVTVYVVDSGINTSHSDFAGRIGAGYSALDTDSSVEDCNGHGTHVAGIAAGSTYGVAKGATIVPLRVFGCTKSGNSLDIIEALQWILDNHAGGPAVINMSLGSTKVQYINDAVAAMSDYGFTVVVASGNEGANACNYSPASEPKVITVGASDASDNFTSWSNYGSCVDLVAAGSTIKSTYIGNSTATANMSGTSMATPHVAGAVARILQEYPTLTPTEVASKLTEYSSQNVLQGTLNSTPNRLLNLPEDINPIIIPDAPTAPTVSLSRIATIASSGKVYISGTHSSSSIPITKYTVTAKLNNEIYKTQTFDNPDTSSPLNLYIDGLIAANTYTVSVVATNETGDSIQSNTLTAKIIYSKPSNVTNLNKTLYDTRTYNINWTAVPDTSSNNGGFPLSGYRVYSSLSGKYWNLISEVTPTTTTVVTPQFQANKLYYIKVVTYSDNWKNASVGKVFSFKTSP